MNHWCLTVDADEWFIYPGYERVPLTNLTAYLDRSGARVRSRSCSTCMDPVPPLMRSLPRALRYLILPLF